MFQYFKEIVQFDTKLIDLPDVGDIQLLLGSHSQYVRLV